VQYARKLIQEGKLGQITHYHGRFLNGYAGNPNGFLSWRFDEAQGLGTLGDLMSHAIDMAHMIAGPIASLTSDKEIFIRARPIPQPGIGTHYDVGGADSPRGDVTNEDYVSALVRFTNGARGHLESCRVINGSKCDMSFEVHGTLGAIKWNFEQMNELQLQWRNDANPAEDAYLTLLSGPGAPVSRPLQPGLGGGSGLRRPEDHRGVQLPEFHRHGQAGRAGLCRSCGGRPRAAGDDPIVGKRWLGNGRSMSELFTASISIL
jgi:predicted dehydrogenase